MNRRHVERAPGGELDHHRGIVDRFCAGQVAQHLLDDRVALFLQGSEPEGDVRSGKLRAVMETRFRPQEEAVGEFVGRDAHGTRRKSVHGVGLVVRPRHERGEGLLYALRRVAF
jgi:hypothetical protein